MRIALEAGAGRVELCQALGLGGLTPSAGLVEAAVKAAAAASATRLTPRGGVGFGRPRRSCFRARCPRTAR
ncbi:copper homeostasis protein CutC [Agromyces albus]|uniref:copper homeostasis protein CutC n=1 Tax=Agromyces albus TaxID=205332 RepID=UPI0027838E16|nr:copper homeostasis protein CutC [Agromyces albus]MDQ0575808.1 copper homeostasis protein CutC [Agromyces albus]